MARQGLGYPLLSRIRLPYLAQGIQDVDQGRDHLTTGKRRGHGAHQARPLAKRLHGETIRRKTLPLGQQCLCLPRHELNSQRLEQPLYLYLSPLSLGAHSLEEDALVSGMLVNEVQAVRALGDNVGL